MLGDFTVNILKKLAVSFMTVCLAFISFAGCSLIELDTNRYYEQTAASFNNSEVNVSLKELINGYYNFGNANYDNSGSATIDGLEKTLETLINRKIMVNTVKAGNAELGIPKIELTLTQKNEVWKSTYKYLNEQITKIEDELRKADGNEIKSDDEDSSDDSSSASKQDYEVEYAPYTKTYALEYDETLGKNVLVKINAPEEVAQKSYDVFGIPEEELNNLTEEQKAALAFENFQKNYWAQTDSIKYGINTGTKSYSDDAIAKYTSNLKKNETNKQLSDVPAEIFYREMDRLFQIYLDNEYLTVYQNFYALTSDAITEEMVLETYKELVRQQKETYSIYPNKYIEDIKNNADTVVYNPNTTDWFKVTHILIKYSDDQSTKLTALKTKLKNGDITLGTYNEKVAEIKSQTKVTERNFINGELVYGNTYTAEQVLEMLNRDLNGKSYGQRLKIFNDYIYRFNMDTGVMNAKSCYYIPADSANDQMVKSFANESRDLRTKGAGAVSSSLVESTYGYHIVMYIGEITQPDSQAATLETLNGIYINPLDQFASNGVTNGKTLLDAIIEKINVSNYSNHETQVVNQIKAGKKTVYYRSVYQDLAGK